MESHGERGREGSSCLSNYPHSPPLPLFRSATASITTTQLLHQSVQWNYDCEQGDGE